MTTVEVLIARLERVADDPSKPKALRDAARRDADGYRKAWEAKRQPRDLNEVLEEGIASGVVPTGKPRRVDLVKRVASKSSTVRWTDGQGRRA